MSPERWEPTTEHQILDAITTGDLKENRYLDVKREIGTSDGSRRETARDIASFAIDGGVLLIGIEEKDGTFKPSPVPFADEAERIEQIATNRADPPVFLTVREIPSDADPETGYIWVEIPPSPLAPHMVDGVYWGRIDRTKGRLTDAQVLRLHSRRESLAGRIQSILSAEMDRDPVPQAERKEGHLYLVAWPISARQDAGLTVLKQRDIQTMHSLILSGEGELSSRSREFAPGPGYASTMRLRSQGLALTTLGLESSARLLETTGDEGTMVDIEFREDGGIRVLMGRMTDTWDAGQIICDGLAVAYARRLVRWATEYGDAFGYSGQWGFGLAASGLEGLSSSVFTEHMMVRRASIYDVDLYRSVTTATRQEMNAEPWNVAERLVGKLLRGLGTETYYGADLHHPDAAQ
jgi:Putative DNA-binding domain